MNEEELQMVTKEIIEVREERMKKEIEKQKEEKIKECMLNKLSLKETENIVYLDRKNILRIARKIIDELNKE